MKTSLITYLKLLIIGFVFLSTSSISAQKLFELMEQDEIHLNEVPTSYFEIGGTEKDTGKKLSKSWENNALTYVQHDENLLKYENTTSNKIIGTDVEWQFVIRGNGLCQLDQVVGGKPRLQSKTTLNADIKEITSGPYTYYDQTSGSISDTYLLSLPNEPSDYVKLQAGINGNVNMVPASYADNKESLLITEIPFVLEEADKDLEIEIEKILAFANPVASMLHIQLTTKGEEVVLSIATSTGQIIIENSFKTHEGLNLLKVSKEGLNTGIYLVNIQKEDDKIIKKVEILN